MEREIVFAGEARSFGAARALMNEMNAPDIADELENLEGADAVRAFRMLKKDKAAEVFAYLSHDVQQEIVEKVTDAEIHAIVQDMFLDDAVDFIEEMPANVVRRILNGVSKQRRDLINAFLQYPEGSAGSIMTVEYVALKEKVTVREAFDIIRASGVTKETIYTCYVIDNARRLLGTVSVRTLLLAKPDDLVGDIVESGMISARTTEDKESLVNDFRKYGLLAMPVVDAEDRLVGIVTVDDAMEVQEEESTEDFSIMAAVTPSEDTYLKTGVLAMTRNRVVWLLLLMLSATVTGAIISSFEDALAVLPALVAFIPMLMDTGGNAGSQSSTLIVRGMALEEIDTSNIFSVLWKELRVAFLCGTALAIVNFGRILLMNRDGMMALTVSIALFCTVVVSKSVGCLLPMGAKRLGLDPAVMASPVITTIVDACSLILYFALAKAILGI